MQNLDQVIEERDVEVHVPKVCIVEIAAVANGLPAEL